MSYAYLRSSFVGYIAVELAGVFNGLGSDTSLFVRKHCALRDFDTMISTFLDSSMKSAGKSHNQSKRRDCII